MTHGRLSVQVDEARDLRTVVLLSGGVDSAALVRYYLDQRFHMTGLFIDYGQLAMANEERAATSVASHFGITLDKARFEANQRFGPGEIRGRNAFLAVSALLVYPKLTGIVALGIHSGVSYYDCSESFAKTMDTILSEYTDGSVRFDAPFLKWDKAMVFAYCRSTNVPLDRKSVV